MLVDAPTKMLANKRNELTKGGQVIGHAIIHVIFNFQVRSFEHFISDINISHGERLIMTTVKKV